MFKIKHFTIVFFFLLVMNPYIINHAQSEWNYNAALYGWFAGIQGTIGVANQQEQFKATVSDLLKNLTFTAGGHFEARNPKVSLILDVFYVGLKKDIEEITTSNGNTVNPDASIKLDEWIFEGAAGYRVFQELDVLLACRVFAITADLIYLDETVGSRSKSWPAFYLGARYLKEFDKNWYLTIRGDAGYGGNGFSYYANAGIGYRFSKLFSMALAYRILNMNYDEGSGIDYFMIDGTMNGFGLGFIFSF